MEHLSVDDLKKLLHGGKITLPEFVRFSGDVNRRNLAAEAADDDDEVSDLGGIRRRQNNWYGERQAPAAQPPAATPGASAVPGAAPACAGMDRDSGTSTAGQQTPACPEREGP